MAFFLRAWSLEISRGRLARQAPAYGWGVQRGRQSTQNAVNAGSSKRRLPSRGGGHFHKQPSLKKADRNVLFHTPTMRNIRLWTRVSHHDMGSHIITMLGCLEVKRKSITAMLDLWYLYFDWLPSFIRHLILFIKIQEKFGLKLGYFQKFYYFFINQVARMACQQ